MSYRIAIKTFVNQKLLKIYNPQFKAFQFFRMKRMNFLNEAFFVEPPSNRSY